jgi:tryptophan synthase alpha subunit
MGASAPVFKGTIMPTNTKPVGVAYSDPQLDGAIIGATGGTAGFYGTTPIVQAAAITAVTNTATGTELATAINALRVALKNIGITA